MSTTAETSPANQQALIRAATPADAAQLFSLVEQLGIGDPPVHDSFDVAFAEAVKDTDDHILFVSESGGVVVGYAFATITRLLYTNGDIAQLQELVVDPSAAKRGIGSQLIAAIERECIARGVRHLTVASRRRGASFYERHDYRSTADYLKKTFQVD